MEDAPHDRLAGLDRLIRETEERRVEQMLHIAFLMADEADTTESEESLRQIEALLARMRVQRVMLQSGSSP
ncbi:hypothetical protein [Methylobacterium iners]|uniref:Uncharacterized protein n=1 Tax=Methylobacterium iners TaxID=418707 RepID=A0ABQ4RTL2_9HYPH|nr:hypothetical protein [Methylobacterium iners]GJD93317.1 hypothetical protein OCOJLMKI_0509 [Methylobacterium iners]